LFARAPLQKLALLDYSADYFFKVLLSDPCFIPRGRTCILTNFYTVCQHRFSAFFWRLSRLFLRSFCACLFCERSNILSNLLLVVNAFICGFALFSEIFCPIPNDVNAYEKQLEKRAMTSFLAALAPQSDQLV